MFKKIFSFFWDKSLLIFLCIGLGNTLLTLVGSQLLLRPFTERWGAAAGYWGPTALMFALTSILSFVLNRRLSFQSKAPLGPSILRFAVVIAGCYLISFALSDWIVPAFMAAVFPAVGAEWVTRVAMLVAQVLFTGLNYICQRLWVFKDKG